MTEVKDLIDVKEKKITYLNHLLRINTEQLPVNYHDVPTQRDRFFQAQVEQLIKQWVIELMLELETLKSR